MLPYILTYVASLVLGYQSPRAELMIGIVIIQVRFCSPVLAVVGYDVLKCGPVLTVLVQPTLSVDFLPILLPAPPRASISKENL